MLGYGPGRPCSWAAPLPPAPHPKMLLSSQGFQFTLLSSVLPTCLDLPPCIPSHCIYSLLLGQLGSDLETEA